MPAVPGVKPAAPKPLDLKAPKTSTEAIQAQMGLIPQAAEAEAKLKGAELSMETGIQGARASAAREASDKANAEKRRIDEQLDKWPYPEFHPTQDNAQSMGGLFSLVATMGMMLGASGKLSAQNAMGAMTGMLDGWKKGRQDLYTREKQNFDTEVARIKTIHDDLKSRFDEYMKLLPLDREAAALEREQLVRLAGQGSVLSAYIEKGQFDQARQLLAGVEKQLEKVEDEKRRAAERADERREREAFQLQLAQFKGGYAGGPSELVREFTGASLPAKAAEPIIQSAAAIGEARQIQDLVRQDPGIVGREGQIRQFVNRYIDSALSGQALPTDQESGMDDPSGQKALLFAKRYASYLVNYERSLAPGSRGFTVAFQKRFNDLMQQNQFNGEGMIKLLDDQQREVATQATRVDKRVNIDNLRKLGDSIAGRAMSTETPSTQPTRPAGAPADAKQAADGHWYSPDPQRPGKYLKWD